MTGWRNGWSSRNGCPSSGSSAKASSLGKGGETGRDNQLMEETFARTGVSVMGKRMFDSGERFWPEEAPFHTPVFVLTHQVRSPWERPGGTTFYFVNQGIESTLNQAREAAGDKDIRIAGGAHAILQYLNAGLVDEFSIALAPVFFGSGVRVRGHRPTQRHGGDRVGRPITDGHTSQLPSPKQRP
jgi:dihydrofolate reductase